jgi:hypothetical protein
MPNVDLDTIPNTVEDLKLNGTNITSLKPLSRLEKLRVLKANGTKVSDLGGLNNLPFLEVLNVSSTLISELSPLTDSSSLRSLSFSNTRVSEIWPLINQTELLRLNCSRVPIRDLQPVVRLTKLKSLNCFHTKIANLQPLAELKNLESLNVFRTGIKDLIPLQKLYELRFLNLTSTQVFNLSPLANLPELSHLSLSYTPVSNLVALSGMSMLVSLDLFQTKVTDISPLRDLTRLEKLDLGRTRIPDFSSLVNLSSLIEGAKASPKKAGLFFLDCPMLENFLRELASEDNPKRTIEALSHVRNRQGLSPFADEGVAVSDWEDIDHYEDESSEDGMSDAGEDLPSGKVIPAQIQTALTFTSASEGPLALTFDSVEQIVDAEQAELYAFMRRQLVDVLEQIPTQERVQISGPIEEFIGQPNSWKEVRFKKVLWLCGNALRNTLSQHDAVNSDPDPHYAKLPPAVAEALRRPVETWNVVVLGDAILRELDARRLGPQEIQVAGDQLAAAEPIIAAAVSDRLVTSPDAASAIGAGLAGANAGTDNIHTRQAQELARGTVQNLVVQILRGAHRIAQDLQNPTSEEAKNFVKEYKSGIYKKLGEWTVTGSVAGVASVAAGTGTALYFYGLPFFEFVVTQGPWLKAYLAIAFESRQLVQVVDVITSIRARLVSSPEEE